MPLARAGKSLGFVWQPGERSPQIIEVARRTETLAVFDASFSALPAVAEGLRTAGAQEVKISLHQLLGRELPPFLQRAGVSTLWVEWHSGLADAAPAEVLNRMAEVSRRCAVIPIISELEILDLLFREGAALRAAALKGSEAAGFVSAETTGILFAAARDLALQRDGAPDFVIWGGAATPEAAAAFLATGAQGVVCESLHWMTDLAQAPEPLRRLLTRLRPEHTRIIGGVLGVPFRVFDKGNSPSVRALENLAHSLSGGPLSPAVRRDFARQVAAAAVSPLAGDLGRQQVAPLGPEAAFAPAFAERFGETSAFALANFSAEVTRLLREAPHLQNCYQNSPAARELGAVHPFIQGAMTWISDLPAFALAVAQAGGLPTIALGLRNRQQIEEDFPNLAELMGAHPYAVNFLALAENPHLDEQLGWIEDHRPPFVVVAAGEPGQAVRLREKGLEVIYIAADEGLLRLALEGGVRWIVLEGQEAGGHVGSHSTLTLAQAALELRRREPELFRNRRLVLAGGIYNRETAFRAAMLGADAVQMGTAYLATREIVDTGALSRLYQRLVLEAAPGQTRVTGESVGLRVRSLMTPRLEAIADLERQYLAGQEDEAGFRQRLESLTARSLHLAARGMEEREGPRRDEATCLQDGQFMSGAVAGLIHRPMSVAELHQDLAAGPLTLPHLGDQAPAVRPGARRADPGNGRERVAITGIALVNSLGNTPREIWQQALRLDSGITEIPPQRWDHSIIYDPTPGLAGKTYCKVGAFQNLAISRKSLGIPPQDFRTMAESTRLTLHLAQEAILDAGILSSDVPRERIGVLISQNSGESASTLVDLVIGISSSKIVESLKTILPFTPELEQAAERQLKANRLTVDDTTLLGRLNCAAGGFISNQYGFMGPCFSVSAACATSLVAIFTAIQMIHNDLLDAAVVGGGEELLTPAHYIEFSALGVLAGISGAAYPPREASRPFDLSRDGIVLGEGGGMVVLERESVARRRGARIYAAITGVGASNSNQGMVESLSETQELAIRGAFRHLDYGPGEVDFVECHATGTVMGDREEVKALSRFFPNGGGKRTRISSFKSQIGHTLGASGVNSLIRGIMALNAGVFPPTLNYRVPDPEINLERQGFLVPSQPEDWRRPAAHPRRLMVNAFGFGGANYVVQMEESLDGVGVVLVSPTTPAPEEAAAEPAGVVFCRAEVAGTPYRLGVVAPDLSQAETRISSLSPADGPLTARQVRQAARQGVFISPADRPTPPLAFIFTGQGSFFAGMGRGLAEAFPVFRQALERLAPLAQFDLLSVLFHADEAKLQQTLFQQPALFAFEYALAGLLSSLGVKPAALAGHSLGELTALTLAGIFSPEDGFRLMVLRAQLMDRAARQCPDPGLMLATDAPQTVLAAKVSGRERLFFTNLNSPRQVVLGGSRDEILPLQEELEREGHWTRLLKVSMAFHSPLMRVIREELAACLDGLEVNPPLLPVLSNTSGRPYPEDAAGIRSLILAHLENPVRWQENVEALWHRFGVRTFVEVGPKDTLCQLVAATLPEAVCLPTSSSEEEAAACRAALARLYAEGHLEPPRPPRPVRYPSAPLPQAPSPPPPPAPAADPAAEVVRREVDHLIRTLLKPAIIEAVRREVDPTFDEARLTRIMGLSADPGPAAAPAAPPAPAPAPVSQPAATRQDDGPRDYLEEVIHIIMDATGYEREELEPHLDIRRDLAIRSSRLPVIMDMARRQFGITVRVEDFVGVNTIAELAERIRFVVARDGAQEGVPPPTPAARPEAPVHQSTAARPDDLRRLVFREAALDAPSTNSLRLEADQSLAVLSLAGSATLAASVTAALNGQSGGSVAPLDVPGGALSLEAAQEAAAHLAELPSLAGLVFCLDGEALGDLALEEVTDLLTSCFLILQAFLTSPSRRLCLVVSREVRPDRAPHVLAEGLTGLVLGAVHEYPSLLWRSLALEATTDAAQALAHALDLDQPLVDLRCRGHQAFTRMVVEEPLTLPAAPDWRPASGDVIVISGGARGVTAHLALALAPFQTRLAILGRTPLDEKLPAEELLSQGLCPQEAARRFLDRRPAAGPDETRERQEARLAASLEVAHTLAEIRRLGGEAVYFSGDVTDAGEVDRIMDEVVRSWGRIDGIIHGAGVIRDGFLERLDPDDFRRVVALKLNGALNLWRPAREHGLRFFMGLCSVVGALGNLGQVNYAAGNRALAAFLTTLASQGLPKPRAFFLPPLEGAGMADTPEMRELLKLRGMDQAYLPVDDMAQFCLKELALGPAADTWVMPVRHLPPVSAVRLAPAPPTAAAGGRAGGFAFKAEDFPMIQEVRGLSPGAGVLEAGRRLSLAFDLWLPDHQPFRLIKHPIVSGIMAVETFLEAARVLYPHLTPLGLRNVRYLDVFEVPPDLEREVRILCRRLTSGDGRTVCRVSISGQELTATGRLLERWSSYYEGDVVLTPGAEPLVPPEGFPVPGDQFTTPSIGREKVESWYQDRGGLAGRYRVMESVDGTGPGFLRGRMIYREEPDFAGFPKNHYQYSPYLLEALMHLAGSYFLIQDYETRVTIPAGMDEILFSRRCRAGEEVILETRLVSQDAQGHAWNGRVSTPAGETIMLVRGIHLRWFGS
ncbi:MAG: SDR family NAD(P)-dependent oxidoreductase [Deltaproteobacteria bacterium]|nr:SDR family NAD(P)-dependent oxidoreductase [Deltaproteobacteria bacterium]